MRNFISYLLLTFLFSGFSTLNAQKNSNITIHGQVFDKITNSPVEYATVTVLSLNDSLLNGTITKHVSDRTNLILNNLGFEWPQLNKDHIQKMLEYCKKIKFI